MFHWLRALSSYLADAELRWPFTASDGSFPLERECGLLLAGTFDLSA